ncbi:MAG: DUF72 domain-containing protein [Pseudomonadota bacterium]|nr:DUF72 domain-containing protein [Pseudomonadota bacterium]
MSDVLTRPSPIDLPAPLHLPPGPQVRVGISGWTYEPWRGTFYPAGLPHRAELAYASRWVASVEINGTFYGLQHPKDFQSWRELTPPDFRFSVKGSRYITHFRRLEDVRVPVANFLASGVLALGDKLGPLLWQLPPWFRYDAERIETFLGLLPRDQATAALVGTEHDTRVEGRSFLDVVGALPLRHAMEVRHPSFAEPAFIEQLRRHNVALVVADAAGRWPTLEDVTADFVYARLHGDQELYASGYSDAALDRWAARFAAWRSGSEPDDARRVSSVPPAPAPAGRDLYVYFDNDAKVHAPFDAAAMAARLGVSRETRERPGTQVAR